MTRTQYANRKEWLQARKNGLGASDVSAALGISTFKSQIELWKEKTGKILQPEESNNRISFGNAAEDPLRSMFRLIHPEYSLTFAPFTILRPEGEFEFLSCTPDGELVENSTGRKGLYESKTSFCLGKRDWEKWNGKIPDLYYCQICAAVFVGDFEFAVCWALLMNTENDAELRMYKFERESMKEDIAFVVGGAKEFWGYVQKNEMPPIKLNL